MQPEITTEPGAGTGPAPPAPVTVVSDPEGDATQRNSDSLRYAAPCVVVRDAPSALDPTQCAGHTAGAVLAGDEPTGVVPAPPARDVLAVRFQEMPQALLVEMELSGLDPSLEGAVDRDEQEGTMYLVRWTDSRTGCITYVGTWLRPYVDAISQDSWLGVSAGGSCRDGNGTDQADLPCTNTEQACNWGIPGTIEYGSPSTLRWEVPRSWLAGGALGDDAMEPWAEVWAVYPYLGPSGGVRVRGSAESYHQTTTYYKVDVSNPGKTHGFTVVPEAWPFSAGPIEVAARELHVASDPVRPDLRLQTARVEALEDRLRFTYTLDRVDEHPRPHDIQTILRLSDQQVFIGAWAPDGERRTWGVLTVWDGEPDVAIPVELQVFPGAPGRVVMEVPRSALLPIPPEAPVEYLSSFTGIWNETEQAAAGHSVMRMEWTEGAWAPLTPRQALTAPAPTMARDRSADVNDPYYDTTPPPDMVASSTFGFDLVRLQMESVTPGEMQFSLGVQDLSNLQVPPGYDAVLYAVALEHERGIDMVGHYRSAEQAGGLFFCAPDTTVFADEPGPPPVSWTQIPGRISTVGGAAADGAGSTSAVLMFAPSDCFGLEEEAPMLNVSALKAGSYVIRRATAFAPATVETLDTLEAQDPFLATFAQPVVEPPTFWAQPFGIENFWDILGIIVAVVTVLVTVVIFLRRRRTFHHYIDEVRRIQETYRHNAAARATALVALRRQLHDDLESHRISDAHYPIVLDRLRARLTSARLTSLGQRFYEVPARISLRIERLLDDGYLAEEEAAVLAPVIEASGMPEETARELVERLRTWVEEDRSEVVA